MDESERASLYHQLDGLGQMIADGLHLESDGKWISKQYRHIAKLLGLVTPKKRDTEKINTSMQKALSEFKCTCGKTDWKQRKGCYTAVCNNCGKHVKAKLRKGR